MMKALEHDLYCLTSDQVDESHPRQLERMSLSGVRLIQIRSKKEHSSSWLSGLSKSIRFAKSQGTSIIINDSVELAKELDADGVHLGRGDCHPEEARELLGDQKIVGLTIHSEEEAKNALTLGVCDYFGVGPVRSSKTKTQLIPTLTLDKIRDIVSLLRPLPAFLIGGLDQNDFSLLPKTGAMGICVCSALSSGNSFGTFLADFLGNAKARL